MYRALHRIWIVLFRPWLGNNCRFHPVCSDYALEAVERFGLLYGGYLALRRIVRCQPYSCGGFDPVPAQKIDGPARAP